MPQGRKIKWQCEKTPKFSAAQFAYIAEIIRKLEMEPLDRFNLSLYFGKCLKHTNNRFNMDAFIAACDPVSFTAQMEKRNNAANRQVRNSARKARQRAFA